MNCGTRACDEAALGPTYRPSVACLEASGHAEIRDRTGDLQIFGLTLSQLSYRGSCVLANP